MTSRGLLKVINLGGELGLQFSGLTLRGKTLNGSYFFTEQITYHTHITASTMEGVADFTGVPNTFDKEGLIRFLRYRRLIK